MMLFYLITGALCLLQPVLAFHHHHPVFTPSSTPLLKQDASNSIIRIPQQTPLWKSNALGADLMQLHSRMIIHRGLRGGQAFYATSEGDSDDQKGDDNNLSTLQDLIENDPKEKGLLGYLTFVTIALLALGIGAYKVGGQLLGLGFADDKYMYFDSAPSYALLIAYPPLFFLYPEARGLLLKTLLASLAITLVIWFFPFDAIGWEPTNEHVLITVGTPILAYLSFFTWRATKVYSEIVEEEKLYGKDERE